MKAVNAGHALAVVLVDELARAGMTDAVIAPGSRSAPVAMALAGDSRIRLHVLIDERSASFLALGIAKASRRPVAVLSTSGTAAAEFHPAVIEAHHARVPLVVLTADRPPEMRGTGAGQTIDQVKLYGDAVQLFVEAGVPEAREGAVRYWRSFASRAVGVALGASGPPGPVHVNLAFREPLVPVPDEAGFPFDLEGREGGAPWTRYERGSRAATDETLERLASEIAAAERGLFVAGDCDLDDASIDAVLKLVDATGWPLIAEPLSNLRAGRRVVSAVEAIIRCVPFARTHAPDLVFRIGRSGTSKALLQFLSPGGRQILVDPDGAPADPERSVAWTIAADPGPLAGRLIDAVGPREDSPWLREWLDAESTARTVIDGLLDADDEPFEGRVARDVADAVLEGGALVVASSMPVRDLDSFMRPRHYVRVLANRGANGIDGFVSTALGVALAREGHTVALAGDLSMLHDQNGLLLARHALVNVTFVVVNNDGGGIFSFLPQAEFDESFDLLFGTPHGIDFAALAGMYGCGFARAERASDLAGLLHAAREEGGVHLIEVRTDRTTNVAKHRAVWEAVARTLG